MSDVEVRLAGVAVSTAVIETARIREVLSASPNAGQVSFVREAPEAGQQIEIALITESPERILFAGELQTVEETYDEQLINKRWDATLIDQTFLANKRRPFGTFVSESATDVALVI